MGILDQIFKGFEPIMAIRLQQDYGFTLLEMSATFSVLLISNFRGSSLCLLLPSSLDKRVVILVTNFALIFGLLFTGPSWLLRLPDSPYFMLCGLAVTGSQ